MRMACKIPCIGALGLLAGVASCSDAVPPASQGAVSVHLSTPTDTTSSCPTTAHWINAPAPANVAMQNQEQVSATSKGTLGIDGENGVTVACRVTPNGSKFDVTANISAPSPDGTPVPTSINLQTTLGPDDTGASGSVIVIDNTLSHSLTSKPGAPAQQGVCSFATKPTVNGSAGIASGRVWASVSCTNVRDSTGPGSACDLSTPTGEGGWFVFENCAN